MKTRKICALMLLSAGVMNAGSIWNYTFTDYFCEECAPVGFSLSLPAPLEIEPNQDFWIAGSQLTSCDTVNPAMYCYGAGLHWRSPGVLQVNFSRQFSYPADWELPTEAQFQIPALNVEGVYTNELRYSGIVETQMFSIIDPPAADTPEPAALWLLLSGLALIAIRKAEVRNQLIVPQPGVGRTRQTPLVFSSKYHCDDAHSDPQVAET